MTARSTHNLKLDGLPIQLDGPDLEVHADGADVALCVRVVLAGKHKHARGSEALRRENENTLTAVTRRWETLTANRRRRQDFPTPESPIRSSLNK